MLHPSDPRLPSPPFRGEALTFRRMTPSDLDRVMEIAREGFVRPWSADLLRREMTNQWSTVLVATEDRREPTSIGSPSIGSEVVVGFIVYWLVHDELHVLNVATAREERRRGIARALMEEAAARGSEAGAVVATLEARRSNGAALALYRSLGYRQVGVRPNYYAEEREDAIVMTADI